MKPLDRGNYELVPGGQSEEPWDPALSTSRKKKSFSLCSKTCAVIFFATFGILAFCLAVFDSYWPARLQQCTNIQDGFICRPEISHFWGQYSPYFAVPSDISPDIPKGCNVTFAQVLSRHGSRYPKQQKTESYKNFIYGLKSKVETFEGKYAFLKDYEFKLGASQLTQLGQQELFNTGVQFYQRYQSLTGQSVPFFRAGAQKRVVDSAKNFSMGFHQARLDDKDSNTSDDFPYPILEISEVEGSNNTLSHDLCPAFEDGPDSIIGHDAQKIFLEANFPPIIERLNRDLPGAEITTRGAIYLMEMCPFETVDSIEGKFSPFCDLFSAEEWHLYDYYQTLGKWYGYSSGNPLGPTQGVGYVNELIARLTGHPVNDHTTVNHTLDDSPETFPIGGDHVLFADFSHDNDMSLIYAALGLFNGTEPLSKTSVTKAKNGDFAAAWTISFAARAYFERMTCSGHGNEDGYSGEYIRILINNRVMPLRTCGADRLGRCRVDKFLDSLSFAVAGGNWDKCFPDEDLR